MYNQQDNLDQLLILRVNELSWDPSLQHFLHRLHPGGVVIDAPLTAGAEAVREFLFKVACSLPAVPFLALREEGGAMDPLRDFLPPLPSPRAVAGKGLAAVRRLGELVGAAFELLGFNTDLAPLLDLASPHPSSARRAGACVGLDRCDRRPYNLLPGYFQGNEGEFAEPAGEASETRAFSSNPLEVAKCAAAFLEGLEPHEVRACGKHFPSLATAQSSNNTEPPLVSKSMAELWREDLVPYRALLPRLSLVLVSTAAYKAYDFDLLQTAGLSPKVVEGLLRVKLGYAGVAIAGGLEMEAVRGTMTLEEAAVDALRAGCDMLLLDKAEAAERALGALNAARDSGKLPSDRIEQALKRIQLAKKGLKPPRGHLSPRSLERVASEFTDFSSGFADSGRSKFENRK
jgi:beta-glucosidase-like glycosyl hydrolase